MSRNTLYKKLQEKGTVIVKLKSIKYAYDIKKLRVHTTTIPTKDWQANGVSWSPTILPHDENKFVKLTLMPVSSPVQKTKLVKNKSVTKTTVVKKIVAQPPIFVPVKIKNVQLTAPVPMNPVQTTALAPLNRIQSIALNSLIPTLSEAINIGNRTIAYKTLDAIKELIQ